MIDGGFNESLNSIIKNITFYYDTNSKFVYFTTEYRSIIDDTVTNIESQLATDHLFTKYKKYQFIMSESEQLNQIEQHYDSNEEIDGLLLGTNLGRLIVMGGKKPPLIRFQVSRQDIFIAGFKAYIQEG